MEIDPHEELDEIKYEIQVKEFTAARMMREVQAFVDDLNELKADRDRVQAYIKTHKIKRRCDTRGCANPVKAKGLCTTHYSMALKAGKNRNA